MPSWVQETRRAAFERFTALGFPTTKNEDWHFTSVSSIVDHDLVLLAPKSGDVRSEELAPFTFEATGWPTAVFVNGPKTPSTPVEWPCAVTRYWTVLTSSPVDPSCSSGHVSAL